MTMDAAATTPEQARPGPRWLTLAVVIVFGLFFAFDLFEALTNLFGAIELNDARNRFRETQELAPISAPWAVLVANLLAPVLGFGVAWFAGRRRRPGAQAVLFLAALATVAAFSITFTAVARGLL